MNAPKLSIFARFPEGGAVKTRLIPALGADGAANVYRRLLDRTLAAAHDSGLAFEVRVTGAMPDAFAGLFDPPPQCVPQGDGDLSARLLRVAAPAIVIGSDAPALTGAILREAADRLTNAGAVIGPASDGGFYLIGFREPAAFALADRTWSHDRVCTETITRFRKQGIEPALLQTLDDIDTPEDLARHPDLVA